MCVIVLRLLRRILSIACNPSKIKDQLVSYLVKVLRLLPRVHAEIEKQKQHARKSIEDSILKDSGPVHEELPCEGMPMDAILGVLDEKSTSEKERWMHGNLTGAVYNTNGDLGEVHSFALAQFGKANLLHPDIFVHTRQMEAEMIRMTLKLFSGDGESCGSVTSGGTESILLAVKAYRDWGRSVRGITRPNMVVPSTAHAAFMKASEYFGIEVRRAACDPRRSFEVDLSEMAGLVDGNTVLLVGSAPQFPHGTMDPIPAIARLAKSKRIGCHVDACLGSLLLPFLRAELPYEFDFRLAGVTSISCDTHKYGYAPKGTSVLMYRSASVRKHQYSVCSDWEGGLYATPTISGSRCSGTVAAAWASMMFMGADGYRRCALEIRAGALLIEKCVVNDLREDLTLLGRTDTSVVSFTSIKPDLNILDIAEWMKRETKKKWTFAILQNPPGLHFAVTMANVGNCAQFGEDLKAAVAAERQRVSEGGQVGVSASAAIYGSAASVPKQLVDELVIDYLDTCYRTRRTIV